MNDQISRVDFRARLRHVLYFLDAHKRPLVVDRGFDVQMTNCLTHQTQVCQIIIVIN